MANEFGTRLLAAIDDAEGTAREAETDRSGPWRRGHAYSSPAEDMPGEIQVYDATGEVVVYDEGAPTVAVAAHIVAWQPTAVLARLMADREIVEDWIKSTRDPYEGLSDDELHQQSAHPAYEYETTEGQRKAWPYVDEPPWDEALGRPGDGWELNITSVDDDAWARLEYTEERYWRRLRPGGPEVRKVRVPHHILLLARDYGIEEQ